VTRKQAYDGTGNRKTANLGEVAELRLLKKMSQMFIVRIFDDLWPRSGRKVSGSKPARSEATVRQQRRGLVPCAGGGVPSETAQLAAGLASKRFGKWGWRHLARLSQLERKNGYF
jgi:hypothetical protein